MPQATIASRQLKNKETGLDLFVLAYTETKGLLRSAVHYQLVLVSNLSCFKTPSNKESDVVQFSTEKRWHEFEELRTSVAELFPGTILPSLNKISVIVNDHVLRERRNSLDSFVRFIAATSKLATCVPVLTFLGVEIGRAKRFIPGESLENVASESGSLENASSEADETTSEKDEASKGADRYIFEEDVQTDNLEEIMSSLGEEIKTWSEENSEGVSMFGKQDLKENLTDEDALMFGLLPDAFITKKTQIREEPDEDHSDLFVLEDDLDSLLTIDVGRGASHSHGSRSSNHDQEDKTSQLKGTQLPKPTLAPKPKLAAPNSSSRSAETSVSSSLEASRTSAGSGAGGAGDLDTLGAEDIMKYLDVNSSNSDNVDLFS